MLSKIQSSRPLGGWFLMISAGTASFLTISEYLKSKNIGLQFSESETKKNTLPNTMQGWQEKYSFYQKSVKPEKKFLQFEEYKEHKKKRWMQKNGLPDSAFSAMLPFANPSVDKFEKIYTANSNLKAINNFPEIHYYLGFFFFVKDSKFYPKAIILPYFFIACFGTAFFRSINLILEEKLENHLNNTHLNVGNEKMFGYTLTSLLFYACTLYFGIKTINPLAITTLKAEEIVLSKTLSKQYSAIIASIILASSCSSYIKAAKDNLSVKDARIDDIDKEKQIKKDNTDIKENSIKELLRSKIYPNIDVNTVKNIHWCLQGVPLLIFNLMFQNPATNHMRNPSLSFFLYFLSTGTEVYNNYQSGTEQFSDYLLRLVFLTSVVVGFSRFRIMSLSVLK